MKNGHNETLNKRKSLNSMQQTKVIVYLIYHQLAILVLNPFTLHLGVDIINKTTQDLCQVFLRVNKEVEKHLYLQAYPNANFEIIFQSPHHLYSHIFLSCYTHLANSYVFTHDNFIIRNSLSPVSLPAPQIITSIKFQFISPFFLACDRITICLY